METHVYEKPMRMRELFIGASHRDKKKLNETVSLEAQLEAFLTSIPVKEYYELVPLVAIRLERVASRFTEDREVLSLIGTLEKSSNAKAEATVQTFKQLQQKLLTALAEYKSDDDKNMLLTLPQNYRSLLKRSWDAQYKKYVREHSKTMKLTEQYILENLLGLRVTMDEKAYEKHWREIAVDILLHNENEHIIVIAHLDDTAKELDALYSEMSNVVDFEALVMLTMWRIAQSTTTLKRESIEQIMQRSVRCAEEDWILAYGSLSLDYPIFLQLHHRNFVGRPVHINLFYIDFDASRRAQATHIDLLGESAISQPISFGAFFAQKGETLELSYMHHK